MLRHERTVFQGVPLGSLLMSASKLAQLHLGRVSVRFKNPACKTRHAKTWGGQGGFGLVLIDLYIHQEVILFTSIARPQVKGPPGGAIAPSWKVRGDHDVRLSSELKVLKVPRSIFERARSASSGTLSCAQASRTTVSSRSSIVQIERKLGASFAQPSMGTPIGMAGATTARPPTYCTLVVDVVVVVITTAGSAGSGEPCITGEAGCG